MKQLLIASLVILFTGSSAMAQSNKEDIAIIQNTYGKAKKEIVMGLIMLDSGQSAPFWKMYDEFEGERKKIGLKRIKSLEDYIAHYETLSPAKADEITQNDFNSMIELDKLYLSYYKKFSKIIGPLKAAKLMQIEDYLRTVVKLKISDEIPFIDDIDKTMKK